MAQPSYYIMNRRGTIKPDTVTDNQCAKPAHPEYHYHVKVMFEGKHPLDKRQFLLDHVEIDQFIQKLELVGSCEEMHKLVEAELPTFLENKGLDLVCYKAVIAPSKNPGEAWLEYVWARKDKDMKCLSFL